ncbi:hypothetical protein VTP01DRAFT_1610 [Rhizomucor pusillus]|uniref:uncharacterized protein n=1 Tax=Rhizomucor pusillus TaxID=4840 RepID=UPI003743BEDE
MDIRTWMTPYAFSRNGSSNLIAQEDGKSYHARYYCGQSGAYRNNWDKTPDNRVRQRETCPAYLRAYIRVYIRVFVPGRSYKKFQHIPEYRNKWIVHKVHNQRNHEPLKGFELAAFPQHCKLDKQQSIVATLHKAQAPTRTVVNVLNNMTEGPNLVHTKTIANARARLNQSLNEGENADTI